VSDKDFVNKTSICLKELRESQVNLKIIKMKPLVDIKIVEPVLDECSQLVAIFTTVVKNKKDNM
jgi:four helix bundle protein